MNKQELIQQLDLIHVPRGIYNLNGECFPDKTTISESGSDWEVFSIDERGNKVNDKIFKSEEEACQYLYDAYSKWFNYNLRDVNRISSLLNKRPQFRNGDELEKFFAELDCKFPNSISNFYKFYNGADGFIGQNICINIFPTESFYERNIFYKMSIYFKDLLLFAIDQNQVGYAISKFKNEIFDLGDLNLPERNKPKYAAQDFQKFLLYLFDK